MLDVSVTHPVSSPVSPSPIFWAVAGTAAIGFGLCATNAIDAGYAVFIFVVAGWVLSLIFHEFAHAYVAWRGGDNSIPSKGYLTLDPRRYADPITSLGLPILLVLVGGIGLPGGAVWINRRALRSDATASFVSLAGPATNAVFAFICLTPLALGIIKAGSTLSIALSFLGFLQITAFVINMLPIPGLDGFGALEPHLPESVLVSLAPVRRYGLFALFIALWYIDPVNDAFWSLVGTVLDWFGIDRQEAARGFNLFRFWDTA